MGVQAMVKGFVSRAKASNSTNQRYFGKVGHRLSSVAAKVEASGNDTQQNKLETIARQLMEGIEGSSGDVSSQLAPHTYERVKKILSEADRLLDAFQPPPKGHAEVMEAAKAKDKENLETILGGLGQADVRTLKSAHEMGKSSPKLPLTPQTLRGSPQVQQELTLPPTIQEQSPEPSTSATSEASPWGKGAKTHARFSKILKEYEMGQRDHPPEPPGNDQISIAHSLVIRTSVLGSESTVTTPHFVPMDETFCGLADTFMELANNDFLPDFWSKEIDPIQNRITPSSVWYEWQDPSKKVLDTINKTGHVKIETVCKEVEYIVALVKIGETENGMPIDVPRSQRLPTAEHFQKIFPDHIISQVRHLKPDGDESDASKVVFDSRKFRHLTSPLVIEFSGVLIRQGKSNE